jgi:hypothetical protein
MKNEGRLDTEWAIFDDSVVEHTESWREVVKQCVESCAYPTVLFYEKVDPKDARPKVIPGSEFSEMQILDLLKISKTPQKNYSFSDLKHMYEADRIFLSVCTKCDDGVFASHV